MEKWSFAIDNEKLIQLVLEGKKVATTYLYDVKEIPTIEEESILCYNDKTKACIVKTKDYKVMKFKEMSQELCELEGEGDLSLSYWKKVHLDFFKSLDKRFNEESTIIFEIFELVQKL